MKTSKKFAESLKDIFSEQKKIIGKHDVGIVDSKSNDRAEIFFIRTWKKVGLSR